MINTKLISLQSISQGLDFTNDLHVIALGNALLQSQLDPDLPLTIPGIKEYIEFNLSFFEQKFLGHEPVLKICKDIRANVDSISFRALTDGFLRVVNEAETVVVAEHKIELVEFTTDKTLKEEVDGICDAFKNGHVQLPLYRDNGIFSLELLNKTMLGATLEGEKVKKIFWPYAIYTGQTTVDRIIAGPATTGRHDREHLSMFILRIEGLLDPEMKQFSAWDVVGFSTISQSYTCLMTELKLSGQDNLIPYLVAITTYYLHEKLGNIAAILSPQQHGYPEAFDSNNNTIYKEVAANTGFDDRPETLECFKSVLKRMQAISGRLVALQGAS
jgi:hypothetical protein